MQRLKELGNEDSAIEAQAGHEDVRTVRIYTDSSVCAVADRLRTPSAWGQQPRQPDAGHRGGGMTEAQRRSGAVEAVLRESRLRLGVPLPSPASALLLVPSSSAVRRG